MRPLTADPAPIAEFVETYRIRGTVHWLLAILCGPVIIGS